jgi:hypothetical protein
MIRDWTASEKIDLISFQAEVFFIRLCMKADDYGSFHASPKLLKSFLFPLRSGSIRETDITRWMAECQKAGLLSFYNADSKPYVRIINFGQRLRNKKNRFPDPAEDFAASCGELRPEEEVEIEVEVEVEQQRELKQEEVRAPDLSGSNLFRKPKIPTKQQVWEVFAAAGGTKEMAKSFFDKYEATGWYANNSPIVQYSALAQKFIDTWKRNEQEKKPKESVPASAPLKTITPQ